jgi:hypothetical protein
MTWHWTQVYLVRTHSEEDCLGSKEKSRSQSWRISELGLIFESPNLQLHSTSMPICYLEELPEKKPMRATDKCECLEFAKRIWHLDWNWVMRSYETQIELFIMGYKTCSIKTHQYLVMIPAFSQTRFWVCVNGYLLFLQVH